MRVSKVVLVLSSRFRSCLRVAVLSLALLLPVATPQLAFAQPNQDEDLYDGLDGRLRGYNEPAAVMEERSTALTYIALIGMIILAAGVMFKASRRTHLD